MRGYDPFRFQQQVDSALQAVKRILDNERAPTFPKDVPHQYDDKYLVAETMTNTAMAAHLNCLELLGLKMDKIAKLVEWAKSRSVTLRFKAEEKCTFDREVKRDVESDTKHATEWSGVEKRVTKTVTTVIDYFWNFEVTYQIFAFKGTDPEEKELLQQRSASYEIKTSSKNTPRPTSTVQPSIDHQMTWLFQSLVEGNLAFSIDRAAKACHTPTRNPEITIAFSYFASFYEWSNRVISYFRNQLFPVQSDNQLDLSKINDSGVFVPVFPAFEEPTPQRIALKEANSSLALVVAGPKVAASSPLLSMGDIKSFLSEEMRSLQEKFTEMDKMYPNRKIITALEARIIVVLMHSKNISQHHSDGIYYIEEMLRSQLISAIGKEVSTMDFVNYMRYHNRKLFKPQFEPQPFCYAVRRGLRNPEGTVGIDFQLADGSIPLPVNTIVRHTRPSKHMQFPINASTKVSFGGDRYIHALVQSKFSEELGLELKLKATARQFSIFMLLVGKIASADLFEPTYAMIVQNKDEFIIPLDFEYIPPPKAFKDAISSLSPEQQRFAQAYRSMQLGGTLFSVCVIQVKPQLERLLQLPIDSLSKEMKLTQDLLDLFITYQIPSDLLSYDGEPDANTYNKLLVVKQYVQRMQDMIKDCKEGQLRKKREELEKEMSISSCSSSEGSDGSWEEEMDYGAALRKRVVRVPQKVNLKKKQVLKKSDVRKDKEAPQREMEESVPQREKEEAVPQREKEEEAPKKQAKEKAPETKRKLRSKKMDDMYLGSAAPEPMFESQPRLEPQYDMKPSAEQAKIASALEKKRMVSPSKNQALKKKEQSIPMKRRQSQEDPDEGKIRLLEQQNNEQSNLITQKEDQFTKEIEAKKQQIVVLNQQTFVLQQNLQSLISAKTQLSLTDDNAQDQVIDYTKVPGQLDQKFEKLDEDSALSATIVNPSTTWTKKYQPGLLSPQQQTELNVPEIVLEKNKAFDLLEALTKSGVLPVVDASLHVMLCATHSFEKALMDTLVQDNMNPIEKLERSNLIIATTIHDKSVEELVNDSELERVKTYCPTLFLQ